MLVRSRAVIIAFCLLFGLDACSNVSTTATPTAITRLSEITSDPVTPTLTPTTDPLAWQRIDLPDVGLSLLAPPDWQALEDGGYWSPAAGSRLTVTVLALPENSQSWEPFLPAEYDLLDEDTFATGLGMGDCLKIAVIRRASQTDPRRFEMHILVNSGDHPAVDFSAISTSETGLDDLRPQLEKLATGAKWLL